MVEANVDIALNINYGFGGHNSAVIFKKYQG
jgi:3-oxoacyl-(acyl-carrier-protein) synthase